MLVQQYDQYSTIDHRVWSILYMRQLETVQQVAYNHFITGIQQLDFNSKCIPEFEAVNKKLKLLTGWQIYAVPGLIPNSDFFEGMFHKRFGATTWIRKPEELDYLEEPDMFHDVFGHIPLLADSNIANYLHKLAAVAVKFMHDEQIIEEIARLYWYTIEFGLIREQNKLKVYGAGILSSIGETEFCLSAKATHVPFDWQTIVDTPYVKDKFQSQYFVVDSLDQLLDGIDAYETHLFNYQLQVSSK